MLQTKQLRPQNDHKSNKVTDSEGYAVCDPKDLNLYTSPAIERLKYLFLDFFLLQVFSGRVLLKIPIFSMQSC
jgi:hypothetical protein